MDWPQTISIGPLRMTVSSWADVREALQELGPAVTLSGAPTVEGEQPTPRRHDQAGASSMNHGDRTLLLQFIEAADRGLLTQQVGQALGKKGKGVRPELDRWTRRIGLVTQENASAFEAVKRFDGRGFKMIDHYRRTASAMIGAAF